MSLPGLAAGPQIYTRMVQSPNPSRDKLNSRSCKQRFQHTACRIIQPEHVFAPAGTHPGPQAQSQSQSSLRIHLSAAAPSPCFPHFPHCQNRLLVVVRDEKGTLFSKQGGTLNLCVSSKFLQCLDTSCDVNILYAPGHNLSRITQTIQK